MFRIALALIFALTLAVSLSAQPVDAGPRVVIEGTAFDYDTKAPIGFVTVRVEGTGLAAMANENGRYRIVLHGPNHRLKISHTSYYSESFEVSVASDTTITRDVFLRSALIDVGEFKVYSRALDPGQAIIWEAIKRKKDILSRLHDYSYEGYTKLVATDAANQDSSGLLMLTETIATVYWEQPDKFKEVITARRQSANLPAEVNVITVGEILNFNRNRIDLDKYSVVSPTAQDALDHYNYYLLDTVYWDNKPVFKLEVEPKNPDNPLFAGFIHIAAGTYDVVAVDVSPSRGIETPMASDIRYSQRYAQFQDSIWMPVEIRFDITVELNLPIPGIPDQLGVAMIATLSKYRFESGLEDVHFDETLVEVAGTADSHDSTVWLAAQTVPLSDFERGGLAHIDSVVHAPKPLWKTGLVVLASAPFIAAMYDDVFRFNRVEGAFLGMPLDLRTLDNRLTLSAKTGYAFEAKRWQHQYGLDYRLWARQRLNVGVEFKNRILQRPAMISGDSCNSTFSAVWDQIDPLDYYRTKSWEAYVSTKVLDFTRLTLTYHDSRDYSMSRNTDFSLFGNEYEEQTKDGYWTDSVRVNPPVTEGRLRLLGLRFVYDSRPLINNKGREIQIDQNSYTRFDLEVEHANPDLIDNDFDFTRYYVHLRRSQPTAGLGLTTLWASAGTSTGTLPPQRYFSVDHNDPWFYSTGHLLTVEENNFGGNRALAFGFEHNFERQLWTRSGIPYIRDIPFWLTFHGGAFWSDFKDTAPAPGNEIIQQADKSYREIGFGLSNLTPFLGVFNLATYFTWQLSDYDTSNFAWRWGVRF